VNQLHDGVALFIALLAGALAVSLVAERLRFPYPIALVVVGAVATQIHPIPQPFPFGSGLLAVFLPALVFEGAWNIDVDALRRRWIPIAILAVPGVLFSAVVTAGLVTASGAMPFAVALVLGAIVAATDPIATIAVFRRLAVPLDLQTIVECESLANDGVAVALFAVAVPLAEGLAVAPPAVQAALALWAPAGGILVGAVVAAIFALLIRRRGEGTIHVVASILVAYGAYVAADYLHCSGIFAAAAAGIAWRVLEPSAPRDPLFREIDSFWGATAFLANAFIFLQMGLTMRLDRMVHEPILALVGLVAIVAARAALVYGTLPFLAATRGRRGWSSAVALSGMRGALGVALVLTLPPEFPLRPQLVDAVFAIVLVTLVVQGTALEPILARLRPADDQSGSGGPSLSS
jgi:CPA1 family monovalent cation:H+ antiporter